MIGKIKTGSQLAVASLYIHIPFCTKKCPYCHFYVLPDKDPFKESLLESLKREWEHVSPLLEGYEVVSIYLGGGTPSLMGPSGIGEILSWLPVKDGQEITLEANPENVTHELMAGMREVGVNRVSLGIQTLDNTLLKRLGRTHTAQKALDAVDTTYGAGIENISVDLMYDLPNQTLKSWELTLNQLNNSPISHLSLYNLTIEPHTAFYRDQKELSPLLPSPEESLKMLEMATSHLPQLGLERYEISAFAKAGRISRHNTGYWTGRPFLGLGPSAFSYWDRKRYRNVASLSKYAEALKAGLSPVDFEERLEVVASYNELLAIHLRLLEGVDLEKFQQSHGAVPSSTARSLSEAVERGWLEISSARAKLTPEGLLFYDSLASLII